jgi:hypothetical protein
MSIHDWAQAPDPEPTVTPAQLLANLGVGQPDPVPFMSVEGFLAKFGLTTDDMHGDEGPLHIPVV